MAPKAIAFDSVTSTCINRKTDNASPRGRYSGWGVSGRVTETIKPERQAKLALVRPVRQSAQRIKKKRSIATLGWHAQENATVH
jgi:hypothetical protein